MKKKIIPLLCALCLLPILPLHAAIFNGDARVVINDPEGGLSWNGSALTVMCWFKISIPSGVTPPNHMHILVDRTTDDPAQKHAYRIWYDTPSRSVKFMTRGNSEKSGTLVEKASLGRWYHVAVVRDGDNITAYFDGVRIDGFSVDSPGDSGNNNGVSIGGWNENTYLYGEVQEVAIYQMPLSAVAIQELMYNDHDLIEPLKGYYKLGYSVNNADFYRNFSTRAPPGTETAAKAGVGTIGFEETNWKGEQSLFDSQINGGKNAIMPLSGGFSWQRSIFHRPLPGMPFDFSIAYCPGMGSSLGEGWSHSFDIKAVAENLNTLKIINWQGSVETWENSNAVPFSPWSTRHGEYRGALMQSGTGDVFWTNSIGQTYRFNSPGGSLHGTLNEICDRNGNLFRVLRTESAAFDDRITNIVDSAGGIYAFSYTNNLLDNIVYEDWQLRFSYSNNRLSSVSVTNTAGLYAAANKTWSFLYNEDSNLLERIINPAGITNLYVEYDNYRRRIRTTNARGDTTRTEYGVPGNRQIRTADPDGYQWIDTYDRKGRIIIQRDPLGNETRYTYDGHGNRTSVTDPLGRTSFMGYDDRANRIAHTNALGQVTTLTYHPVFNKPLTKTSPLGWTTSYEYDFAGNLLHQYDDLGTLASYTYTARGQMETATDANGNTSTNFYNAEGYVTARADPSGATAYFNPNEMGWNLAMTNALGETTTYTYDINGNVLSETDALGRTYSATYSPCGKLLSQTDGKGQTTRFTYNNLGQQTSETDGLGNTTFVTYNARGNIIAATDALGHVDTSAYDAANRAVSSTDALGNTTETLYDACGNPVATVDPLGRCWSRTLDRLNRTVAQTDPSGNTVRTIYDADGRVVETIAPHGKRNQYFHDGRGRLIQWLDAAGSEWGYEYDAVGNLTNVTDALGGSYAMAYGPRNERIMERNQDGFEWYYAYDELMRLKTATNPNGTVRTLVYDSGSRLTNVVYNTGRSDFFQYDANDNLVRATRGGAPGSTGLGYDALDRLTSCTNMFGHTVVYARDSLGRPTTVTYPDGRTLDQTYDPLDRLTAQSFHFGYADYETAYAYDAVGRLTSRTYPNGIVQTKTFDAADRLAGIAYAPTNEVSNALELALQYSYDDNGNPVRAVETGAVAWPMPTGREETAAYHPSGRLIQRDIDVAGTPSAIAYHYDAGGNMTNALGNGQSWTLTYDENNRVVAVDWDAGFTSKHIANQYDAFGRRVARTVDGIETRYALDLAGSMERILCDITPAGIVSAWYIHGPDLSFKLTPTGGLNCFHANAQGNIAAVSGAYGMKLVEYAYTPYGRNLGIANHIQSAALDVQPFQFCGSQGVMMEERGIPGFYFMRARYYSTDAGVFLSIDPVRPIGPTWRPIAYGYADGNPLLYNDPSGEWSMVIGAVVGAVVNVAIEATIQAFEGEWDTDALWGAAVEGAVTGFLIGTGVGAFGAGAAGAFAGSITEQMLKDGSVDWAEAGIDAGIGGVLGKIGGGGKTTKQLKHLRAGKRAYKRSAKKVLDPNVLKNSLDLVASRKALMRQVIRRNIFRDAGGVSLLGVAGGWGAETMAVNGRIMNGIERMLGLFEETTSELSPQYIPPAIWHPSTSPVFLGCPCGN